jgi:Ca2+/Na+ antiporter
MIDQILKFLCILSVVTFLFKRLPLLINKNVMFVLLGCFILYILYSIYKKWKEEEKIKEKSDPFEETIKEKCDPFEETIKEKCDSFEERFVSFEERFVSFEERFVSFEEKIITILQENRPKGKKKN